MDKLMILLTNKDWRETNALHAAAKRTLRNASLWLPVNGRENQEARYTLISLYYQL